MSTIPLPIAGKNIPLAIPWAALEPISRRIPQHVSRFPQSEVRPASQQPISDPRRFLLNPTS